MFEKLYIKILIVFLVLISLFFLVNARGGWSTYEERNSGNTEEVLVDLETKDPRDYYSLTPIDENKNTFTNYVDGYAISVPSDLKVDMTRNKVVAILENQGLQVEIYRQELESDVKPDTYIGYSNQFIFNTVDHKKEWEDTRTINGHEIHVLQWSREVLQGIANDKNYYAVCDIIVSDSLVYTFYFKSTTPLVASDDYLPIVESFQLGQISKQGVLIKEPKVAQASVWSPETAAVFAKYFSEESPLTWGIFEPCAPEFMQVLHEMEDYLEYEFPFLISYQHFDKDGLPQNVETMFSNAKKENRILELSLQTTRQKEGEGNMVYAILNGEFDQYIHQLALEVKKNKMPILMRFCNEMNGDWCMYSSFHTSRDTQLFQELYRYVYEKFEEKGALPYTIWVFNPNEKSMPNFQWNDQAMYYPGNAYVDVIGLTGYNTGTYYPGEIWRSFDEIYQPIYMEMLRNYDKPMMITEFASSSVGGDKEAWILDMYKQIQKYDKIKVAIWWNGRDLDVEGNVARPYWLNETEGTYEAFKASLKNQKNL